MTHSELNKSFKLYMFENAEQNLYSRWKLVYLRSSEQVNVILFFRMIIFIRVYYCNFYNDKLCNNHLPLVKKAKQVFDSFCFRLRKLKMYKNCFSLLKQRYEEIYPISIIITKIVVLHMNLLVYSKNNQFSVVYALRLFISSQL